MSGRLAELFQTAWPRAIPAFGETALSRVLLVFLAGITIWPIHAALGGEFVPLPAWYLYGGGINSTWSGDSSGPERVQISVTMNPPPVPNQYGTAVATGSAELLQISPATTYVFTLSASVSGSAGYEALTVDGSGVIAHTLIGGVGWKRYTNTFTTAGPEDPRVGRPLNVQLLVMKSGFNYGTATATFTNMQLWVSTARPTLALQPSGNGLVELRWPTNFHWYVLESSTNLADGMWEEIGEPAVTVDQQQVVSLPNESSSRFFRLRQP